MADMWIRAEKAEMIRKHGNYHIKLQDISENTAGEIADRQDVYAVSGHREINLDAGKDYGISGRKTVVYGVGEAYLTDIRGYRMEGGYPENANEIVLSADAKELFGLRTGDGIVLHTPEGDLAYTISGFCEDDSELNEIIEGCCVYLNMEAFQKICAMNGEDAETEYYIRFAEDAGVRRGIADIKEDCGIPDENVEENTAVLGLMGASSSERAKNIYPLAGMAFLLILIAGVLMISSCINSNVAQRTKFFGMLRCIGASRRQIMRLVRLEALNWCKTAIPAGCILGAAACQAACAVLRLLVKGEYADMPLFGISIPGIVCGILVGVITVFIAAHAPAKQAASVSPVAAVSGNAGNTGTVKHAANTRFFKVETTIGIHHAVSAKKNLFLITGSFTLSIILFLIFSAGLDIVRNLVPSESNFAPDLAIASKENDNAIDVELVEEISKIPGVESVFGTMMAPGIPALINGTAGSIDLVSYDDFMMEASEDSVASGELSKAYGDTGCVMVVFQEDSRLDVGDKITLDGEEVEISCVLSFGIGGVTGGIPTVVCSEETFTRLTGEHAYSMVNTILMDGAPDGTVEAVRNLAGGNEFVDRREEDKELHSSYWVFRVGIYGFLVIIVFITVLNIMNSISMSVTARIRQYGAMRAVGMDGRQIAKMITAEAAAYAVCGSIAGLVIGLLLHYLFYEKLIISHFGGVWKIPYVPIAVILLLVAGSCAAAVLAPVRRIRGMEITETINEL